MTGCRVLHIVARITETIFVVRGARVERGKSNISLGLKFSKRQEEVCK